MADFSTLIASIEETIKTNGVQAITGQILQDEMLLMVSAINQLKQDTLEGYAFYGQVLADGGSASVTQNTFFLVTAGTYTINGNTFAVTSEGVSVVVYDSVNDEVLNEGLILPFDNAPTSGSTNPITSGAVAAALAENPANFAACLYDRRSAGTPQSPYTFRQSGGDGVDYLKRIKGRTLVWNQLVPETLSNLSENGVTAVKNANGTYTLNGTATGNANLLNGSIKIISGHSYIISARIISSGANTNITGITGQIYGTDIINMVCWPAQQESIGNATGTGAAYIRFHITNGDVYDNVVVALNFTDLTLLGWVPSSVSEFRAVYPLSYYSYTPALLINNAATALESTGSNQWDEETKLGIYNTNGEFLPNNTHLACKNPIRVFPNTAYHFRTNNYNINVIYLAADGVTAISNFNTVADVTKTTPVGCYYIVFNMAQAYGTTYNHDICVNISDPSRNGTYEPYWKATRHLGLDAFEATDGENVITVNGLKSAGSVYDEIIEGKKFVNRIETRAYQSGDENNSAVTTDGTNTNYALATPKEYELVEPIQPMLDVDELGTERRLPEDTADAVNAPFESDSNYSVSVANLVRKLSE